MTKVLRFAISLLLLAVLSVPVFADGSLFGTLAGKVRDESGAALPGVTIEARSVEKGFVRTGAADSSRHPLETNLPGVFAIGDVRAGSVKRVAAAVGEGAQVVAAIHAYLAAGA